MTPPVSEGEELEVTIEAVGEKGDGIAKKQGFVIFVPGGKQGQNLKIKITKVLQKVAFSEVLGEGAPRKESKPKYEEVSADEMSEESDSEESPEDSEDF